MGERGNKPSKNHIIWVIPNYREEENSASIRPLTRGAKFKIGVDDSFDPSAFLVAGVFAGISMAQRQYAFGHGAPAFAKYYGGAVADQAIGNMMTEGALPGPTPSRSSLFHQSYGRVLEAYCIRHQSRGRHSGRRRP